MFHSNIQIQNVMNTINEHMTKTFDFINDKVTIITVSGTKTKIKEKQTMKCFKYKNKFFSFQ
jgi:hypothetical protein